MNSSSIRLGILFIAILAVGVLVNTWAYLGEAHVDRKPLKDFPDQIGAWQKMGSDQVLDPATMQVLKASDYVLRDYVGPNRQSANFYVGYYATQREGVSYHSPLNCLPGAGWMLSDPAKVTLPLANGSSFTANKYIIQNGSNKSLMIYWYQGRGRAVASEYWGKIYTVIDSVRLRRSDGALVRVTVPLTNSEADALRSASDLAAGVEAQLGGFVPN
jgi:EpsI family protein